MDSKFCNLVSCVIIYFFTGHMELHDKIISSACESKLADFVMFVSSDSNLILKGQMEYAMMNLIIIFGWCFPYMAN